MVFCWKCGTGQQQDGAAFCFKCGAALRPSATVEGRPGFEVIRDDKTVQNHWLARLIALIIDAVFVAAIVVALVLAAAVPFLLSNLFAPGFPFINPFWWLGGIIPLIILAYFVLAEWRFERTIGKEAMGLRVVRVDGKPMDFWSAFVRNVSKIHILLLVLDAAAGLAMRGDTSQKFSDRFAGTKVETVSRLTIIT